MIFTQGPKTERERQATFFLPPDTTWGGVK